ncbi:hypothetical protein M9Y10_018629 [Tritrichomonas musculus]|uniref:Uncharacterized protein n=1 Tax=Tritrichomonas musculus TaxID=1915356 RepID=A0ABR2HMA0_9EUKA
MCSYSSDDQIYIVEAILGIDEPQEGTIQGRRKIQRFNLRIIPNFAAMLKIYNPHLIPRNVTMENAQYAIPTVSCYNFTVVTKYVKNA